MGKRRKKRKPTTSTSLLSNRYEYEYVHLMGTRHASTSWTSGIGKLKRTSGLAPQWWQPAAAISTTLALYLQLLKGSWNEDPCLIGYFRQFVVSISPLEPERCLVFGFGFGHMQSKDWKWRPGSKKRNRETFASAQTRQG